MKRTGRSLRRIVGGSIIIAFASSQAGAQPDGGSSNDQPAAKDHRTGSAGQSDTASSTSLPAPLPRTTERADERHAMVRDQIQARGVRDQAVLRAMGNVPRHWFVPANRQRSAYDDRPLPIGESQTISQPYIVALMTEALGMKADSKVLEVGTGSGYQAAVLAEITTQVYTIEIVEPLARRAIKTFQERGYKTIKTKIGDGYAGWQEHAPFDAIIVTCAPGHVPPKLFEQLRPGGRMCIPVGEQGWSQSLQLITKSPDGQMLVSNLLPVRFVPMTGRAQQQPAADTNR